MKKYSKWYSYQADNLTRTVKYKFYKKCPILVRGTESKLHFVAKIKKKKKLGLGNYNLVKEVFVNQSLVLEIHLLPSEKVLSCSTRSSLQQRFVCQCLGSANKPINQEFQLWVFGVSRVLVGYLTFRKDLSQSTKVTEDLLSIYVFFTWFLEENLF